MNRRLPSLEGLGVGFMEEDKDKSKKKKVEKVEKVEEVEKLRG